MKTGMFSYLKYRSYLYSYIGFSEVKSKDPVEKKYKFSSDHLSMNICGINFCL